MLVNCQLTPSAISGTLMIIHYSILPQILLQPVVPEDAYIWSFSELLAMNAVNIFLK